MKKQHVINCSFSSWYQQFKNLTIPSKIIKLPTDFVDYLRADGIHLPSLSSGVTEGFDGEIEEEQKVDLPSSFEDVKKVVEAAIKQYGGYVFVKLNWSSPKDAAWIAAGHSLKCYNLNDIIILLKTSEFVTHDLTMPFDKCEDNGSQPEVPVELVIRKWMDINPSMEFRVFVRNHKIRGISQRDHTNFFTKVAEIAVQLRLEIMQFFDKKVKSKFADTNYVFDIYRKSQDDYILLDFNPFGEVTDALLFTWDEIHENSEEGMPEFRCVESSSGIQPSPYLCYGYPKDIDDIASGENPGKLIEFLKLEAQRQANEESDDESDET